MTGNFTWGVLWTLLMYFIPRTFARIISSDAQFLDSASQMLKIYFIESAFGWAKLTTITILQSVQTLPKAGIYNIVGAIIGGIGGPTVLFFTDKENWARMMYTSSISGGIACFIGMILCAFPISQNLKKIE